MMKGSPIIGRTAGLSALASGETPALLVAVKPGGIGNLNVAAGISAVAQSLAAQSAAQAAEIADLKRQMSALRAGLLQLRSTGELAAVR
jgi:hypothetical protein